MLSLARQVNIFQEVHYGRRNRSQNTRNQTSGNKIPRKVSGKEGSRYQGCWRQEEAPCRCQAQGCSGAPPMPAARVVPLLPKSLLHLAILWKNVSPPSPPSSRSLLRTASSRRSRKPRTTPRSRLLPRNSLPSNLFLVETERPPRGGLLLFEYFGTIRCERNKKFRIKNSVF